MPMASGWSRADQFAGVRRRGARCQARRCDRGFGWPEGSADAPAAISRRGVQDPISYTKNAKEAQAARDMADALFGRDCSRTSNPRQEKAKATPVTWCREGAPKAEYAVYRAMNDGRWLYDRDRRAGCVDIRFARSRDRFQKDPGYRLSSGLLGRTMIYPSFDKSAPACRRDRRGKRRTALSRPRRGAARTSRSPPVRPR